MVGRWLGCPVDFEHEIFLEVKNKVSLIWALWVESYFISLSIFFCSPFLYLHSLFYFIWTFLYWFSTDKCLALGGTTCRLWLQIAWVLLGNFFFLSLFSVIFSSFMSLCFFPCREDNQAVEQDAQRNCAVSIVGGFQDQTGVAWVNCNSLVWHQSWPCLEEIGLETSWCPSNPS